MPAPSNPADFAKFIGKPLNKAEDAFRQCMERGEPCIFGDGVPDEGDETNTIRADLIRFFARGGDETCRVQGNIIYLQGAWIPGFLNLAHIPSSYSLVLRKCHFADSIIMPHSTFHFLNLSGSLLKEELVGDGVKIKSDILMGEGFTSESEVRLCGAHIGGNISCYDGKFKAGEGRDNALNAAGIKINGGFAMGEGFVADGEVCLIGADIDGDLSCNKGQFKNAESVAISADKIKVKGGVHIGEGLYAEGEVRFIGADIGAGLHCDGGKFVNKGRNAFCADNMKVSGSVFMREKFIAEGEVQLLGATISGDWYCSGAIVQNEEGKAIVADRVRVGGNLHMQEGFFAKGDVRLSGAHIGGDLSCNDGYFNNKKGEVISALGTNVALVAQGIQVGGSLLLGSGFYAAGAVVLHNAKIGNYVFCDGFFINKNNTALAIDDAAIGSDLSLHNISVQGEVRLIRADVGGQLRFGGKVYGDVIAESAKIGTTLLWRNMRGKGKCDLSFASAGVFHYDDRSLRGFAFILDGFSYKRLAKRKRVKSLLKWMKRHLTKEYFSPQPFERTADVLFAMGHNNDAREILLKKEKLLTKHDKSMPLWNKFWRKCWHAFAGYGYRLKWTAAWMGFFVLGGTALFDFADRECRIVPHQPIVMTLDKYKPLQDGEKCTVGNRPTEVMARAYPDYPRFGAFVYSLDVFIPYFSLHKESHWYPQPQEGDADLALIILRVWYWIEIIAGWVLTSLLVLTITGLLKPRQSSLE